jgi:hypothetical protein
MPRNRIPLALRLARIALGHARRLTGGASREDAQKQGTAQPRARIGQLYSKG